MVDILTLMLVVRLGKFIKVFGSCSCSSVVFHSWILKFCITCLHKNSLSALAKSLDTARFPLEVYLGVLPSKFLMKILTPESSRICTVLKCPACPERCKGVHL